MDEITVFRCYNAKVRGSCADHPCLRTIEEMHRSPAVQGC